MNQYLTCPKCHQAMQSFTRSGLTVEQCTHCRGVFLDYGELERLVQLESQYYANPQQPQMPPMGAPTHQQPMPPQPMHGGPVLSHGTHRPHGHAFGHGYGHSKHHRKSLLGELFFD